MNNEQPTSFSALIKKLRDEYTQLKERVGSLHSFLCDIDFEKRVPDPVEQRLMREQLHMMLGYMDNLRARISYNEEQQIRNRLETIGDSKRGLDFVRDKNGKVVATLPGGLIHKGLDDVDLDKSCDELKKAWAAYCKENHELEPHHCGQDAHDPCGELGTKGNPIPLPSPVDDGSAAVEKPIITGESLKQLLDYQVVGVCEPGFPCEGCVQDHYNTPCVKVELVGGHHLCLAPLPNSIVTE